MSEAAVERRDFPPLLRDKHALVTGGSRGLGRAICQRFAAHGARITFTYARDHDAAAETVAQCDAYGVEVSSHAISVLDGSATEALVQGLEDSGAQVDVLVNNAGILQGRPLALTREPDWDKVLDVNLKGAFLASRAVLRGMIRRRAGVILHIGSIAALRMTEAPVHYSASKAGLQGLTGSMAREMGRYGIRVLCLAPGLLEDGVVNTVSPRRLQDYLRHCALGRVGTMREVAELAAFLVSDGNSFMTGETILIDGGV